MLRLQTVVQSTLFPKKKSARLENLSKPPQGASKLASFDTVLAVRTLAVTFFLRRTCSCRLSASLPSHLTPDKLVLSNSTLSFNPTKKPSGSPVGDVALAALIFLHAQSRIDRVSDHCMRWCMHRAFRRWTFGCRTRTSLDSNSCFDNGFFLRVLSLDTSSSTYFPLFQLALRPASTPDSNRRRSSISPPRNHVAFSLAKQVSFEHPISSPSLLLLREGKKNIQTNDRQMTRQKVSPQFVVDRSCSSPRSRSRPTLQRRDFP